MAEEYDGAEALLKSIVREKMEFDKRTGRTPKDPEYERQLDMEQRRKLLERRMRALVMFNQQQRGLDWGSIFGPQLIFGPQPMTCLLYTSPSPRD